MEGTVVSLAGSCFHLLCTLRAADVEYYKERAHRGPTNNIKQPKTATLINVDSRTTNKESFVSFSRSKPLHGTSTRPVYRFHCAPAPFRTPRKW